MARPLRTAQQAAKPLCFLFWIETAAVNEKAVEEAAVFHSGTGGFSRDIEVMSEVVAGRVKRIRNCVDGRGW
eukprot:5039440-Pleurochrysis_carterae.AAC.2